MKSLVQAVLFAAVLTAPLASFAHSSQPLTRAEVRAELVQLEAAGYDPSRTSDSTYPADIQAAEARVAARNAMATSVGGAHGSTSDSGSSSGAQH